MTTFIDSFQKILFHRWSQKNLSSIKNNAISHLHDSLKMGPFKCHSDVAFQLHLSCLPGFLSAITWPLREPSPSQHHPLQALSTMGSCRSKTVISPSLPHHQHIPITLANGGTILQTPHTMLLASGVDTLMLYIYFIVSKSLTLWFFASLLHSVGISISLKWVITFSKLKRETLTAW